MTVQAVFAIKLVARLLAGRQRFGLVLGQGNRGGLSLTFLRLGDLAERVDQHDLVGQAGAVVGKARIHGEVNLGGIRAEEALHQLDDLLLELGPILQVVLEGRAVGVGRGPDLVHLSAACHADRECQDQEPADSRHQSTILPKHRSFPGGGVSNSAESEHQEKSETDRADRSSSRSWAGTPALGHRPSQRRTGTALASGRLVARVGSLIVSTDPGRVKRRVPGTLGGERGSRPHPKGLSYSNRASFLKTPFHSGRMTARSSLQVEPRRSSRHSGPTTVSILPVDSRIPGREEGAISDSSRGAGGADLSGCATRHPSFSVPWTSPTGPGPEPASPPERPCSLGTGARGEERLRRDPISYWALTRRPLPSLLFVLPILAGV